MDIAMERRGFLTFIILIILTVITFTVTYVNYYEERDYYIALSLEVGPGGCGYGFFEGGNNTPMGIEFMDAQSQDVYRLMLKSFRYVYVNVYRIKNGKLEDFKVPFYPVSWFEYNLKAECLTAVSHYLRALEQYLQSFKDDEFLVEVYLRCLNESLAREILQGKKIPVNFYSKKVVGVLYVGKGGRMVAFVTEPYNILLKFRAKVIPPYLLLLRICLAVLLPLILFTPPLIASSYEKLSEESAFQRAIPVLILILLSIHASLVASLLKEYYSALEHVGAFSIRKTLAPLGYGKALRLTLSEGNINIRLKDIISEYELQALKRVCSYFKEKEILVTTEILVPLLLNEEEFIKIHYLNASVTKVEDGVLVPLEELDELVVMLSVEELYKPYETYVYIRVGVPVEAYRIRP
ncbi:MAG: hypothetical protein DRJ96_06980 [Thermoprotei archaeon]|nr:MAG: hypothetical protein DRJ96_06980 [Thermoprotei archaeon]